MSGDLEQNEYRWAAQVDELHRQLQTAEQARDGWKARRDGAMSTIEGLRADNESIARENASLVVRSEQDRQRRKAAEARSERLEAALKEILRQFAIHGWPHEHSPWHLAAERALVDEPSVDEAPTPCACGFYDSIDADGAPGHSLKSCPPQPDATSEGIPENCPVCCSPEKWAGMPHLPGCGGIGRVTGATNG